MFDTRKTLLAATSVIALAAGPVFAESHVTVDDTNASQAAESADNAMDSAGNALENAGEATENAAEDAAQATGNALENAGEATENAAEDAAEATENTAEDAAQATENAAEATGDAVENAAESTAAATASLGDKIEAEFADIADRPIGDLTGTDVATANGDEVGEIDDFAMQDGKLVALVGIGGFLGLGEHDVALDLSRMSWNAEEEEFVVNGYTEDELKELPQYDKDAVQILDDDAVTLKAAATETM
ncbi:PRC-barrel domain-containing protein [Oceaniglobus roseus]|uniref:PRC-barrel domain-containing protein n=1 Tax=Oceaniglobus roseus TaxID=1737570 RepID=UPI000C7F2AC6|nr:PRC-barrel domain-containing protein [Kandeliimicrobium roseum]